MDVLTVLFILAFAAMILLHVRMHSHAGAGGGHGDCHGGHGASHGDDRKTDAGRG